MLDSRRTQTPKFPQSESWSIDAFDTNDVKTTKVVRKFISSAIYVEKPITEMPPSRKTSPYFLNCNSDSEFINSANIPQCNGTTTIKQWSYNSTPKKYLCRNVDATRLDNATTTRHHLESERSPGTNSSSDIESQITVKSKKPESPKLGSEMRLSLSSLTTERNGMDLAEKEKIIKNWLWRKDQAKKQKEIKETEMRKARETERQIILEKERENFKKWLADKKREEEKNKMIKQREEEEKKLREAEKEKRQVENELRFHMWLRRKKRMELERKIKEKLALLQVYEDKQKRIEQNEKAFNEWLKNSWTKPKPIPLNQGLKSLCSSTSVTYINPIPWKPNIEVLKKPASQ